MQPQFGSGRSGAIDWTDRLTHTGVLARLGPQTGGLVTWRDLTALPCSHPHCCSVGLPAARRRRRVALADRADRPRPAAGVPRPGAGCGGQPDRRRRAARARCGWRCKDSLLGLLSEQSSLSHPRVGELWRDICENCDLGISTLLTLASSALPGGRTRLRKLLGERVKRITVKPFMDMATMIEERLAQCCVHVATAARRTRTSAPRSARCRRGRPWPTSAWRGRRGRLLRRSCSLSGPCAAASPRVPRSPRRGSVPEGTSSPAAAHAGPAAVASRSGRPS